MTDIPHIRSLGERRGNQLRSTGKGGGIAQTCVESRGGEQLVDCESLWQLYMKVYSLAANPYLDTEGFESMPLPAFIAVC